MLPYTAMSAGDKESTELVQKVLFCAGIENLPAGSAFWLDILKAASRNRVLYCFALELKKRYGPGLPGAIPERLADIITAGDKWQQRLKHTLLFIKERFAGAGIPFLAVKTRRSIPYVTYDVDILVRQEDYPRVSSTLQGEGEFCRHPGKQSRSQMNFFGSQLLTIDIHKDFSWQGFSYLDKDAPWQGIVSSRIAGADVFIPSAEIEFLLYAAHIIYERRHITLLDLNNLVALSKEIKDAQALLRQVRKFGWQSSFIRLLSLMNGLTRQIYPFFKDEFNFVPLPRAEIRARFQMPYFLSPVTVAGFFREKIMFDRRIPFWDIAYYIFATARYYLGGRRQFPYYRQWYTAI